MNDESITIEKDINDNRVLKSKENIEEVLGKLLIDNKLTLSSAESCTGGLIASRLVSYSGISKIFIEGVVTYSNEAKMRRLNVKKETLDKFGAVSEAVAIEMAQGIVNTANTDIGISTTGIAGPEGGTDEKPVGLVYIGICVKGKSYAKRYVFNGDRNTIRNAAAKKALNMVKEEVEKIN